MRNKTALFQKTLALLLTLVFVISSANLTVFATGGEQSTAKSVTDGELVAGNYDLTDGEKAILVSGLVKGDTHEYQEPSADDNSITVDTVNKTVTAAAVTKGAYTWTPVSAAVVYSGGSENVALDSTGKGNFKYAGNNYRVDVTYETAIQVDAAVQTLLLNGPDNLITALDILDYISDENQFYAISDNSDSLEALKAYVGGNQSAIDAINSLLGQISASTSNVLDIEALIYEYDDAQSKSKFLFEKGAAFKSTAQSTYEDINAIYNSISGSVNNINVKRIKKNLENMLDLLEEATDYDWPILGTGGNPFKTLTDEDYATLDSIAATAVTNDRSNVTVKANLKVTPATVSININQYNVAVSVTANVVPTSSVNSTAKTSLKTFTTTIQIISGATSDDVLAAVAASGIEAQAIQAWVADGYDVSDTTCYARTTGTLPATVSEDVTYSIGYDPVSCTVTTEYDAGVTTVPYGYNMLLPICTEAGQVYDYYVNSVHYLQGKKITITGDTDIKRSQGKPWTVLNPEKITAEVYAEELNDAEEAILQSAAIKSSDILVRKPTNDDGLVTVTQSSTNPNSYTVKADNYPSGISGAEWVAEKLSIMNGDTVAEVKNITGGQVSFESSAFDSVKVTYTLSLNDSVISGADVLGALNLPKTLADEAAAQKNGMSTLYTNLYRRLEDLDRATLNLIKVGVNGSDMSKASKDAVAAIISGCSNSETGSLYLYEYLTDYHTNGLAYYYENYSKIVYQVQILKDNLNTINTDLAFDDLLEEIGYEEYKDKINEIIDKLTNVVLPAPNDAIDVESPSLADLVNAINALSANEYTTAVKPIKISADVTAASPANSVVTIVVDVKNSAGDIIGTASAVRIFSKTAALTAEDINGLNNIISGLVTGLDIDTAHYETTDTLNLSADDTVTDNTTVNVTYSPKQYTVNIVENNQTVSSQQFYFDDPKVTLSAAVADCLYYYTVCGNEIVVGSEARTYTFTTAQINNGTYAQIERRTVDSNRTALFKLIDDLNNATLDARMVSSGNNSTFAFIPVEDGSGNLNIFIRVAPKNFTKGKIDKAVTNIVKALVGSDYSYIKLGNEFLREDNVISLQAFLDSILYSGFNLDTILSVITEDGDVIEMAPIGTPITADANNMIQYNNGQVNDADVHGGKLLQTTLDLGTAADQTKISTTLYVTIEDFDLSREDLEDTYKAAKKLREYGNITAHEGMIDVDVTLPDRVYQAYLTALLALKDTTLDDLNNVNFEDVIDIMFDLVHFIADDSSITTTTFENTGDKVDYEIDLSSYRSVFNTVRDVLKNILSHTTFTNETYTNSKTYAADVAYDFESLLDEYEVADSLRNVIKENGDDLDFKVKLTVNNTADYQAIVIDKDAAGAGKLVYTRNLPASIASAHDNTVIILLGNYTGDLTINKKIILDLNGRTINGNLVCNAETTIVDSSLATESGAGVTGSVSGKAVITAGKYTADVTSLLKGGYSVENGFVHNGYYKITDQGNGNIEIRFTPDMDVIEASSRATLKAIAYDLIADIALNYYTSAAMDVDSYNIYSFNVDNVVKLFGFLDSQTINDLLDCINCTGITRFANDLLGKMTDLTAIGNAIKNNTPVAEYTLKTKAWAFEPVHVTNGDYVSVNVMPDDTKTETQKFSIYVNDNDGLSDLFLKMGEITTIDAEVELESIDYDYSNDDVVFTGNGMFEVTIDMTDDPNFAIAIGVILADGIEAKRADLVAGINSWYTNGTMEALKAAFDNVTTKEFVDTFGSERTFAQMLSNTGLTGVVDDDVKTLYSSYRNAIINSMKIVEQTGVWKGDSKKISWFETEYGVYSDNNASTYTGSSKVYGKYGVRGDAELTDAIVTVKLFKSKIKVTNSSDTVVYEGDDLAVAFSKSTDGGSTVEVLDDVKALANILLGSTTILKGADKIDFNGKKITLANETVTLTSDISIDASVASGIAGLDVKEEAVTGGFLYKLDGMTVTFAMSLSLNDEIQINCYVLNLIGAPYSNCYIKYTYKDETKQEPLTADSLLKEETSSNSRYVIAKCAAKEMVDEVTIAVYYNNGDDNQTNDILIKEMVYSIRKYCEDTIDNTASNAYIVDLCHYVLDYGMTAQDKFNYKIDDLANKKYGVYREGHYYENDNIVEIDDTYNKVENLTGIQVGASLSLEYRTQINFYVAGAGTVKVYEFDGNNRVEITDDRVAISSSASNGTRITVKGTAAKDLNKIYQLEVGTDKTFTYSALSYAYRAIKEIDPANASESLAKDCAASKALFNYYLASVAYFNYKQAQENTNG